MKRVLIITYYWPPSGGAGVQRWLKFSKFLPEFGWEPVILTVDPEYATYPVTDPSLINDTAVEAARFNPEPLAPGDDVWVVGIRGDHQLVHQRSTVSQVGPLNLPLSRTLRFRDSNLEAISLVNAPTEYDGVLVDKRGRVMAMWSSFAVQSGGTFTAASILP